MKIRFLIILAGLAIGFVLPTFAQQTSGPDPQLREQLLALGKKVDEVWNSNDAAAVAALYMEDAIEVTDQGPLYGRAAIEKWLTNVFKQIHVSNHLSVVDPSSPHIIGTNGNEIWGNGQWTQTFQAQNGNPTQAKGYWSCIVAREGMLGNFGWKPGT
jgi:ketosteroid isomerase-like protein